jgi:hypothetical protein
MDLRAGVVDALDVVGVALAVLRNRTGRRMGDVKKGVYRA